MYPETTPIIRDIIKRRYELIPYLYSLALDSHMNVVPPQRWTGWGYESDPEVWNNRVLTDGETQYWLGDSLLIGGVYEPGVSTSRIYLPKDVADPGLQYLDLNAPQSYYPAGQWIELKSKWDQSIPVLGRVGGAVPIGRPCQTLSVGDVANPANLPRDDYRAIEIFPPAGFSSGKEHANTWYEDDGISPPPARISAFTVKYRCDAQGIKVTFEENLQPGFLPAWQDLVVILPAGDKRAVTLNGKEAVMEKTDGKDRAHFRGKIGRSGKGGLFAKSKI